MSTGKPRRNEDGGSEDSPPYSRLFIVCERRLTEEDFREAFSKFGSIEDIRIPRNHATGQSKGVVYIKFSKTSEAAHALEAMNRKSIKGYARTLKVMVASSRSDIHTEDNNENKYKRLFITVPQVITEKDIEDAFSQFGKVVSVVIQRDRATGNPKGFAYVSYSKFSEAATAFEECDRKYRAIFAMPKDSYVRRPESIFDSNVNELINTPSCSNAALVSMMSTPAQGYTRVNFMCCPNLTRMHLENLFDLIPGLVDLQYFVDINRRCGKGLASYSNPVSAAYAVEKLNEFEYPPGLKIFVRPEISRFDMHNQNYNKLSNAAYNLKKAINSAQSPNPDLAQLTEAIGEASRLLKMATTGVTDDIAPDTNDLSYCSVKLPPPQPLADIDSDVAKRCFLVCQPQPPPLTVLRDIFCRFGNLINVYTLPNKTVGYARYANSKSADDAINVLHGAEVCGVRIKVLEADDEKTPKKRRMIEQ
ncbi:hypothetical protein HW555_011570 [Spodoptera exigua]|uniref:RRM domain-containing protein n=1 Tax=Spodoptera exigua TaxID=7107 RepID=A0A835G6Q5_SPOEX|nr:hypothetical protein HW555_011570 [Spodoptera exigua]KAH9629552.1 hypothetical protein HF086_014563 [Spodoptera exigua]